MHEVEADVTGLDNAQDGVEVRAVAIHQAASLMHQIGDFAHMLVEQSQRIGIREHQASGAWPKFTLEVVQIDVAACACLDFDHLHACHRRRRRIGAVRRIGTQDFDALVVATVAVIGAKHQDAGELALRSGGGLQRYSVESGDLSQQSIAVRT